MKHLLLQAAFLVLSFTATAQAKLPGGFFVEVNYAVNENEVTHLFAFEAASEDDRLPDYAMFVKLPDWVPEAE